MTTTATIDLVQDAKDNLHQAKGRIEHALSTTSDDRINWSPTPSARTPVQVVAHVAMAVGSITDMLAGNTVDLPNSEIADRFFREAELEYTTREQVLGLLDKNCARFVELVDGFSSDQLDEPILLPFGMGSMRRGDALKFAALHTHDHVSQILYIQTAYGDLDWHMGH